MDKSNIADEFKQALATSARTQRADSRSEADTRSNTCVRAVNAEAS